MTAAHGGDEYRRAVRRLIDRQPAHLDPLQRVCLAAVEALSACGAGISVMDSFGTRGVGVTSDPVTERVEELQFVLGEGPGIDAFAARRPVLTADLADAAVRHWPVYAPAAGGDGVRAAFAFPLQMGAARLGVLDVYRDRVGSLTGAELGTALGLAEITMATLLDLHEDDAAVLDVGHRAALFQAQGMVMVQLGVSIGEALARMRAHAYAEDRRLEEVARDVVDGRLRWDGNRD